MQVVISGNMGPKAFSTLHAAGIDIFTGASGTVQDALDAFKDGSLQKSEKANVEGHWM